MILVITNTVIVILDECMTLWGEPERVHMQNMDQVHAQDYHQNVTEPQATEYHTKRTLV